MIDVAAGLVGAETAVTYICKASDGVIRRVTMLQSALPFGSYMKIYVNNEVLLSSKVDDETDFDVKIGPQLNIATLDMPHSDEVEIGTSQSIPKQIAIKAGLKPFHVPAYSGVTNNPLHR